MVVTSASRNTRTSPEVTNRDFQIASPLPECVPRSGRMSADAITVAPAVRATIIVESVESESMTITSSTTG